MKSCRSEIERLLPVVRQFARALVEGHRADVADDLVHDAVNDALRGERAWHAGEIEFRLFSHVVGANRLRLRMQADRHRGSLPGVTAHGDGTVSRSVSVPLQPPGSGLDGLPLGERETLLLVVLGNLDYHRVADLTGVPIGTVVARLANARDRLGTQLWAPRAVGRPMARTAAAGSHLRLVKSEGAQR